MPETAPTAPRRVLAFLDAHEEMEGNREDIARIASDGTDLRLTVTDVRAVLALAELSHQVLEHLYFEIDDDGVMDPTPLARLGEDVAEWRNAERAWTWHPDRALAALRSAEATS